LAKVGLRQRKFKTFDDGQKTLGCPIGPDLYVQDFIKAKIDNV
jgi:hypothetical protein